MIQVYARAQDLGMKMMAMKDKNMPFQDIWNGVQAYEGQSVAMYIGDLYILDLCLAKMK
jgi:DNA-directed RNA polymerase delta subunit